MKDKFMVILLKELVILPNQEIKIELVSEVSKNVVNKSCEINDAKVLVVAPISQKETDPSTNDLPKIGVVANIKSKFVLPNGNMRVTLIGEVRVIVKNYYFEESDPEVLKADTLVLKLPKFNPSEESAVKRKLKKSIKNYVNLNSKSSNAVLSLIEKERDLSVITDTICRFLPFDVHKKLEYMQMINPLIRAQSLIEDIEEELEIIKLEIKIDERVQNKMLNHEKDFFIKEKINVLKEELGEINVKDEDVNKFKNLLSTLDLSCATNSKILNEINKYDHVLTDSSEAAILHNYLDTVLSLPWKDSTDEFLNSEIIKSFLDSSHFGLNDVKERICDYADIKKLSKKCVNPVLCLIGPPGVGKTTIASKIAESLNRKFVKISVGGLNDSLELIGSRRTYMGASPGKIIDGIKKSGVNNPVILIDEVDKIVKDYKGDPASILLDVLDQNQNKMFVDNYIEEPFDLSNVLFILTANYEEDIPYILRDRLEIINIDSYAFYEKEKIATKYLLPNIFDEYNSKYYNIKNDIINFIIKNYTSESGVRELDRELHKLVRKIIIKDVKTISEASVKKLLGEFKYFEDTVYLSDTVGVVNALACTQRGGVISNIEVTKVKGSGNFKITGNVEKIMEESVLVGLSYIKTFYNINTDKYDFHIHFLTGSVSKDGPSAGISITTALLSLFLKKKISIKCAFSGEISLNGKVLAVGGVKEKIVAAINSNLDVVYLPKDNENDIVDIPNEYLKNIKIKFISDYKEVYDSLFKGDEKINENRSNT